MASTFLFALLFPHVEREIRFCRPCSSALIYGCKQRGRQSLEVAAEAVLKSSAPSLSAKYLRCGSLCGSLFKNDFYFRPLPPSEGSSDVLRSVQGSTWCLGTWRGPLPSKEKISCPALSPHAFQRRLELLITTDDREREREKCV